jgi:hypothetical protein
MPAKAGIQYSVTHRIEATPRKTIDDGEYQIIRLRG